MHLLVVEDDALLGDAVRRALVQEHYTVDWARDGADAARRLRHTHYDLVLLDLNLPQRGGLDILRTLRARGQDVPVLILTARDTVDARVTGLDAGADDYLVKPFDIDELGARVRALLRRGQGRANPQLQCGDVVLDPQAHTVSHRGLPVELSPREFVLLRLLMENAGKAMTRVRLEEALYGDDKNVESNAVEVHVHNLRKKFGKDLICTLRGVGYLIGKDKP